MRETPRAGCCVRGLSQTGICFAALGWAALLLPFVQYKPNRIVLGQGYGLAEALPPGSGWSLTSLLACGLLVGALRAPPAWVRLAAALAGLLLSVLALGLTAWHLDPDINSISRIAPASGFWLLVTALALMSADTLAQLRPSVSTRWLLLLGTMAGVFMILASGWLDGISVMREYQARSDLFWSEALRHIILAFGALSSALLVGIPLGISIYELPRLRQSVFGILNSLQTIPSLALFGIMIPIFSWIAASFPGAARIGIAGIGIFPALVALFLYSLLPIVSNTAVGLTGVDPSTRDAAYGIGMTRGQVLIKILLPLATPVILAAVRITLVQNIGLAVIAGLIGGGGFGTFVFQGLNQTAMDLILVGAIPTIALAIVADTALGLMIEPFYRRQSSGDVE